MTKQQENNLDKKSGIKNLDFFVSIHDLRHSHTSMLVHLGENPKMIQERLGHANLEMTLGTYSHLYPNQDVELVKKLDQIN